MVLIHRGLWPVLHILVIPDPGVNDGLKEFKPKTSIMALLIISALLVKTGINCKTLLTRAGLWASGPLYAPRREQSMREEEQYTPRCDRTGEEEETMRRDSSTNLREKEETMRRGLFSLP